MGSTNLLLKYKIVLYTSLKALEKYNQNILNANHWTKGAHKVTSMGEATLGRGL